MGIDSPDHPSNSGVDPPEDNEGILTSPMQGPFSNCKQVWRRRRLQSAMGAHGLGAFPAIVRMTMDLAELFGRNIIKYNI